MTDTKPKMGDRAFIPASGKSGEIRGVCIFQDWPDQYLVEFDVPVRNVKYTHNVWLLPEQFNIVS